MRLLPFSLLVCSVIWGSGAWAASTKNERPQEKEIQTHARQHHATRLQDKVKAEENEGSKSLKALRDKSGRFVKKEEARAGKVIAEPGASARCKDGTLSHSKQHSGACSRHGGVSQWLAQ